MRNQRNQISEITMPLADIAALTPEALAEKLGPIAETLREAYSLNTQRVWRANWRVWCDYTRTIDQPSFPTDLATIERFIKSRIAQGRQRATIEQYLYTLSLVHRLADIEYPLDTFAGQLVLKAMRRNRGLKKAQRQAKGLTQKSIETIIDHMDLTQPIGLRDRALLLVAYETLFRRAELVALNVEDVESSREDGHLIYLGRSKTDQEGKGDWRPISDYTMSCLNDWLACADISSGALFRTIPPAWKGTPSFNQRLDGRDVARIFKRRATRAGFDSTRFSGHSTRVGAATDLYRDGASTLGIMLAGGWKSEQMVRRYTAKIDAADNAMQKKLARRGWAQ